MVEDPNEQARRAFGEGTSAPPPATEPREPARPEPREPAPAATTTRPIAGTHAGALAPWGTRAAAFVLDALFLTAVGVLVALVAMVVAGTEDRGELERVVTFALVPIGLLYAPLLMARRGRANGQTLGKQMLDIRVVREDGRPVAFWHGVTRQILGQQLLLWITVYLYGIFDYLWPLRDRRNQALHDKIARTLVVRTAAAPTLSRPSDPPSPADPPPASPRRVDEAHVHGWLPPSPGA